MNDIVTLCDSMNNNDGATLGNLIFAKIPADHIELPQELFDNRIPMDPDTLTPWLPIIVYKSGSRYSIIDGCKRFSSRHFIDRDECSCGIMDPAPDIRRAGILRIRLNRGRVLHPREKLLFIRWLKSNLEPDLYDRMVPELRLSPGERHECEKLLTCSGQLVEAVLQGTLDPTVAPEMAHLSIADAEVVLHLFATLSFSRQMQRELVEWLFEIAFISRSSIAGLIGSPEISGIIGNQRLNAPQRAAALHECVFSRRFPLYARAKKAWTEHIRKVNPDPARVTFQASPSFEKNQVDLRIRVTDAQTAQNLMAALSLIPVENWEKIINPTLCDEDS
jgi:hypothetical protein